MHGPPPAAKPRQPVGTPGSRTSWAALAGGYCGAAFACWATRQGERSFQFLSTSLAHAVVLSVWQRLQAFGIFRASLSAGVMKRKVWGGTFTWAMVWGVFGMWRALRRL